MDYSDKVIENFMTPQNAYSMPDADFTGRAGDYGCGDSVEIYIKVKGDIISEISYLVYGCPASIATSSALSVLAKGKSLKEASEITEQDVVDALDGLPEEKKHCSNLGVRALKRAIKKHDQAKSTI